MPHHTLHWNFVKREDEHNLSHPQPDVSSNHCSASFDSRLVGWTTFLNRNMGNPFQMIKWRICNDDDVDDDDDKKKVSHRTPENNHRRLVHISTLS